MFECVLLILIGEVEKNRLRLKICDNVSTLFEVSSHVVYVILLTIGQFLYLHGWHMSNKGV